MANDPLTRAAKRRREILGRKGLRRKPPRTPEPRQFERKYAAELVAFVREIENEIDRLLIERLPQLHDEATRFDSWADDVDEILESVRLFSARRISEIQAGLVLKASELGDWNLRQYKRSIRAVLGVDVLARDANVAEMFSSWVRENVSLIKSIPDQMLTQVEGIAQRGLRSGRSPRDLAKEIRGRFGVTESRARLIARDQIGKLNGQITQKRQTDLGVDTYFWQSSNDERVRPTHDAMEGKLCRWDDPTVYSDDMGATWKKRSSIGGVELHPGEDYQCFPGNSKIHGLPSFNKLYRRVYSGVLHKIILDNGVILTATPNHPIVTTSGVKPIESIGNGDNVICEMHQGLSAIKLNGKSLIPTFEEVFRSISLLNVGVSISSGSTSQFHGDGTNGKVEIIDIDSLLVSVGNSSLDQKLSEFGFTDSDMMICDAIFSSDGDFLKMFFGKANASSGLMSRFDLISSLLISHFSPLDLFTLGLRSHCNAAKLKMSSDSTSGNSEMFSNRIFALSAIVHGGNFIRWQTKRIRRGSFSLNHRYASSLECFADSVSRSVEALGHLGDSSPFGVKINRVVDINIVNSDCHVYNLETVSGYYNTNTVMVSNCRCAGQPNLTEILGELGE